MTHKQSLVRIASWEGRLLRSPDGVGVRLGAQVAHGGFGVVHRGWIEPGGREVAVKLLIGARDDDRVRIFREEAALLATLRHPNIAGIVTAGVADEGGLSRPWMAIDWCDGRTLAAELAGRAGRRHDRAEAWALLGPIVDAVAHAHARGCVHRDLKPANVMLVPGPGRGVVPMLIDWGIGKRIAPDAAVGSGDTATQSALQAFTATYAAPEQIAGLRTGPWTDVHALGLMFSELLIGRPPIERDRAIFAALDPTRPTPAAFGVDAGPWEPILARALSLHANQRFRTAGELAAALGGALGGPAPTVQVPPPAPAPTLAQTAVAPPAPRGRGLLLAGAGLAAAALAGGLVFLLLPSRETASRKGGGGAAAAAATPSTPAAKPVRRLAALEALDDAALLERAAAGGFRHVQTTPMEDHEVKTSSFTFVYGTKTAVVVRYRFSGRAALEQFRPFCKKESPCAVGTTTLVAVYGQDPDSLAALRGALAREIPGVELKP